MSLQLIYPDWPLRDKVTAFTTSRIGGVSTDPYNEFNSALHVGDNEENVLTNRNDINQYLGDGVDVKWLKQTHSTIAVDAATIDAYVIESES